MCYVKPTVLLITLAFPAYILGESNQKTESPYRKCFRHTAVRDAYHNAKTCFKVIVNAQIMNSTQIGNNSHIENNKTNCTVEELTAKYNIFIDQVNTTCFEYFDTSNFKGSNQVFLNLLEVTLKNNTIGELYKTGGVGCIKKVSHNITRCITNSPVGNVTFPNSNKRHLWRAKLVFDQRACDYTRDLISVCITEVIKKECTEQSASSVDYVKSLFDLLLNQCSKSTVTHSNDSSKIVSYLPYSTTTIMALIFFSL